MSFLDKLLNLPQQNIRLTKDEYITKVSRSTWEFIYLKYWKLASQTTRIRMLLATSAALLSIYVASPSIAYHFLSEEEKRKMFSSKRLDKYTTGMINTRNDCFANSSIQAFAALPGLVEYLNDMIKQHKLLESLPLPKDDPAPGIPLHEALATIVQQLQEPVISSKHISVWPFLQVIEKIFKSKISTNQNDAHELVQLILESLDNEVTKLKKFTKQHKLNLLIPELPFNGLLADQLTCYSCLNSSKPSFHPFAVLSLPVPQERFTSLKDMLKGNEVETINGYHCLRCKISAILKAEDQKRERGIVISENEAQIVSKLKIMEPNLTINDDLPEELENFIKTYQAGEFKTANLLSNIVKKTLVIKAPALLTIHLSRSMFTANHLTRNGCRVEFEEHLSLDVDELLAHEYEQRQKAAARKSKKVSTTVTPAGEIIEVQDGSDGDVGSVDNDHIEGYDDDRNEPEKLKRIHSKVLTQHDEQASTVDDTEHFENANDTSNFDSQESDKQQPSTEATSINSNNIEEEEQDDEEENGSINSDDAVSEELNITKDKVKYKLRSVIRHQGTHQAGHYECYRHKPHFAKDMVTDKIVYLSPKITFGDEEEPQPAVSAPNSPKSRHPEPVPEGRPSQFLSPRDSVSRNSDAMDSTDGEGEGSFSRFRTRLGSMVSRRSSVSNTSQGRRGSIAPVAESPSPQAPVNDVSRDLDRLNLNGQNSQSRKRRYKKVPSVVKHPYWRISDTVVSETKSSQLLSEKTAVYMLYYEMVRDDE